MSPSELIISATDVPTPFTQTGSSVTVLTADTPWTQQRRTVPVALQQVPGLNVVQAGVPGGQTSVFVRASNPNPVQVLIDGIDAAGSSSPHGSFDVGRFLTDNLFRVEALCGPQSGLYGSHAIGGAISFRPNPGEGTARAIMRVEGGPSTPSIKAAGRSVPISATTRPSRRRSATGSPTPSAS